MVNAKILNFAARVLFPKAVRKKFWQMINEVQRQRRVVESSNIPLYNLQYKHILATKLLTDREELLKLMPKDAVVAEIGVDEGTFTRQIINMSAARKLHLVDVWGTDRYHEGKALKVQKTFEREIDRGGIEINRGLSTEVLSCFPDEYFDWVYVDSAHTYETTALELLILKDKVKQDGIICGHDYITSCWQNAVRYGVVEAVHEFCVKWNWKLLYLTSETHQHRSFGVSRIPF